jgi:hypothetical protein
MRRLLGGTGVCLLLATMILSAQIEQSVPTLDNETSGSWFVELASPPTVDGTAIATLEREEQNFHAAAKGAGLRTRKGDISESSGTGSPCAHPPATFPSCAHFLVCSRFIPS